MKKISFLAIFLLMAFVSMSQVIVNKVDGTPSGTKVMIETSMGNIMVQLYDQLLFQRLQKYSISR